MRLSSKERLALRMSVELGRRYGQGPVSLNDVAEDNDLPRPYLAQIAVELRKAGLLTSVRGAQGGYMLTTSPEATCVGDVIRAVEGSLLNVDCAHADSGCCQDPGCVTKSVFESLAIRLSDALDHLTIADVLADEVNVGSVLADNRETLAC